jgi:hypothetical protein
MMIIIGKPNTVKSLRAMDLTVADLVSYAEKLGYRVTRVFRLRYMRFEYIVDTYPFTEIEECMEVNYLHLR